MSNEIVKWTMVTRLEYLAAGGEPYDRDLGICADIYKTARDYTTAILFVSLQAHPLATGSRMYPIPSTNPSQDPQDAFQRSPDLWVGEYGALRRDFAAHAARYLREKGYE
ncbi:hypothetical protein PU634_10415 [Oceanimonas pelagia]|uniref:Uncharacterized protein n=1 Tax=Oceanimonas pelagia TaxID=3028314 RepID=A0AA50KLA4_9GAMM|nr:hypothetical protein [Oceanimonas pelagia]WMC09529.1 hypothetical protein PU634_10415 [Oceanimonas pelagia]